MKSEPQDAALRKFFASLREEFAEEGTDLSNRCVVPEGQRRCPICEYRMTSAHEKGVRIDICDDHGMWLDKGELRAIVRRSQQSDLVSKLKAREEAESYSSHGGDFATGFALGCLMG